LNFPRLSLLRLFHLRENFPSQKTFTSSGRSSNSISAIANRPLSIKYCQFAFRDVSFKRVEAGSDNRPVDGGLASIFPSGSPVRIGERGFHGLVDAQHRDLAFAPEIVVISSDAAVQLVQREIIPP
jgi:hypothetical protein